ncbi:hypothetical protein FPV67DRAFT_1452709 [Lyophyllum atratum]|nr:hypothetical protein FPV67DRAFT_1452709 [Lyophyllum atratum]
MSSKILVPDCEDIRESMPNLLNRFSVAILLVIGDSAGGEGPRQCACKEGPVFSSLSSGPTVEKTVHEVNEGAWFTCPSHSKSLGRERARLCNKDDSAERKEWIRKRLLERSKMLMSSLGIGHSRGNRLLEGVNPFSECEDVPWFGEEDGVTRETNTKSLILEDARMVISDSNYLASDVSSLLGRGTRRHNPGSASELLRRFSAATQRRGHWVFECRICCTTDEDEHATSLSGDGDGGNEGEGDDADERNGDDEPEGNRERDGRWTSVRFCDEDGDGEECDAADEGNGSDGISSVLERLLRVSPLTTRDVVYPRINLHSRSDFGIGGIPAEATVAVPTRHY